MRSQLVHQISPPEYHKDRSDGTHVITFLARLMLIVLAERHQTHGPETLLISLTTVMHGESTDRKRSLMPATQGIYAIMHNEIHEESTAMHTKL